MEQTLNQWNSQRNTGGTFSLKVLANKVLEGNKGRNKPGTAASKSVPPIPQSSTACGTNAEVDFKVETDIRDNFEERLAIAEYDGHQSPLQAQRIAYLDAFITVLNTLPYEENYGEDLLQERIKAAQEWLIKQELGQPS